MGSQGLLVPFGMVANLHGILPRFQKNRVIPPLADPIRVLLCHMHTTTWFPMSPVPLHALDPRRILLIATSKSAASCPWEVPRISSPGPVLLLVRFPCQKVCLALCLLCACNVTG